MGMFINYVMHLSITAGQEGYSTKVLFRGRRGQKLSKWNAKTCFRGSVMFLSLQHFISLHLNYCPACKPKLLRGEIKKKPEKSFIDVCDIDTCKLIARVSVLFTLLFFVKRHFILRSSSHNLTVIVGGISWGPIIKI